MLHQVGYENQAKKTIGNGTYERERIKTDCC